MSGIDPYQLHANAKVNVGGAEGTVVQSDGLLTFVTREGGKVDTYQTEYVLNNASIVEAPKEPEPAQADPVAPVSSNVVPPAVQESSKDQQIADLEKQLADLRSNQSGSRTQA